MFFLLKHLFNYNSVQTFTLLYIKFLQKNAKQMKSDLTLQRNHTNKRCLL